MGTENKSTDSCSGGVSWFYRKLLGRQAPFEFCCDEHDLAYEENGWPWDKLKADWRFYKCVRSTKRPIRAIIFLIAVSTTFGWIAWLKWAFKRAQRESQTEE